MHKGLIFWLFL